MKSGNKRSKLRWEYTSFRVKSTRNKVVPDGPGSLPNGTSVQKRRIHCRLGAGRHEFCAGRRSLGAGRHGLGVGWHNCPVRWNEKIHFGADGTVDAAGEIFLI